MTIRIAVLELGEAGSHLTNNLFINDLFINDLVTLGILGKGWDPKPQRTLSSQVKFSYSNGEAVIGSDIIFSVNGPTKNIEIAKEVLPILTSNQYYCEMNTCSPQRKKQIGEILQPSGINFIDLAIMSPVPPLEIKVPLLASGEKANSLAEKIKPIGLNLTVLNQVISAAAVRKLLRSIVYKGLATVILEALMPEKTLV